MVSSRLWFYRLAMFTALLAMLVVLLGAYTRLGDAGLGCPDWPGCYGQLTVPNTDVALEQAAVLYPDQLVEGAKAWKEMFHRYFAGTLGGLIFILACWAWLRRRRDDLQPVLLPTLLVLVVVFQAALGMWTVTWRLHPLVVMGHLLGGMSIVTMLWLLVCRGCTDLVLDVRDSRLHVWSWLMLLVVVVQIMLGGWTSANYASVVCSDFPTCHGSWLYDFNFAEAFDFFRPIGANYEGGVMSLSARETLQVVHRYWGLIVFTVLLGWSMVLMLMGRSLVLRILGLVVLLVVSMQVLLGVLNVILGLPMVVAVMHNGGAMVLLVLMAVIVFVTRRCLGESQ